MGRCQKVPVFAYFEWDLFKIKEALIYLNRLYLQTFDIGSRAYSSVLVLGIGWHGIGVFVSNTPRRSVQIFL